MLTLVSIWDNFNHRDNNPMEAKMSNYPDDLTPQAFNRFFGSSKKEAEANQQHEADLAEDNIEYLLRVVTETGDLFASINKLIAQGYIKHTTKLEASACMAVAEEAIRDILIPDYAAYVKASGTLEHSARLPDACLMATKPRKFIPQQFRAPSPITRPELLIEE